MADPKDEEKLLKEIEDSLFEEFNEQVRLTEPTDSRLQANVDLNPNIVPGEEVPAEPKKEEEKKAEDSEKVEASADEEKKAPIEEATEEPAKPAEGLDLGSAFASVVDKDIANEMPLDEGEVEEVVETPKTLNPIAILKFFIAKIKEQKILSKVGKLLKTFVFALFYPFKFAMGLNRQQKLQLLMILLSLSIFSYFSWDFYHRILHPVKKSAYLLSFTEVQDTATPYPIDEKREVFF
ncbi:MAG: hypothetical protein KDD37_11880, partial [Bdellovibrionales bacterium]|nr:hypothetical protein [Bdellovibrionales bacterium]